MRQKKIVKTPTIQDDNFCNDILIFIEDKDLYIPIENDDWIVRFLRPCKFYPESARTLVSVEEYH